MSKNKNDFVVGLTDDIKKYYKMDRKIGQPGQFGYAVEAVHGKTGERRAVKVISKARFLGSEDKDFHFAALRSEIQVMKKMDHPNIIKFFEVFENEADVFIVMELCTGGELFDRLKDAGSLSEQEASKILRQMVEGVRYMHEKKIAHCDLKPDNFLFASKKADAPIKVIDFGMAKFVKKRGQYFRSLCGTPYYVAPEVIQGKYNHHADMWSLGVVMFVMLFGFPPFYADQDQYGARVDDQIFKLVQQGFDPRVKEGYGAYFPKDIEVSASARDLIAKLLVLDVAKRLTAEEAMAHPWLKGETALKTPLSENVLNNLRTFTSATKFKQACLELVSDSLTDTELKELQATFKSIDKNGDGKITLDELAEAYAKVGENKGGQMALAQVKEMMDKADLNKDGVLSYQELLLTAVERKLVAKEERLYNAFKKLDVNGDGKISVEEIQKVLGKNGVNEAEQLLADVDKNGDGSIDYEEFISAFVRQETKLDI